MKRAILTVVMVLMSTVAFAQEKPVVATQGVVNTNPAATTAMKPVEVPPMPDLANEQIKTGLLTVENAELRLAAAKAEFQALMERIQKPGFVIARGQDGKFVYQPEKPVEVKK